MPDRSLAIMSAGVWVTADVVPGPAALAAEVPIEFAGAGAWEALVLASVLAEQPASVVVLGERAVALHHSLQRQVGPHLQDGSSQFIVITHSPELLPLGDVADVEIVRLDRDNGVTVARPLTNICRARMSAKLIAKGNEGLPFAWRAVLCEGQDDVGAVLVLAGWACTFGARTRPRSCSWRPLCGSWQRRATFL